MIQVKENDLQSMNQYKENEEGMQSMWLSFSNDSKSIIFSNMFQCFFDYQYYTIYYWVSWFKNGYENEWKKKPLNPSTFN